MKVTPLPPTVTMDTSIPVAQQVIQGPVMGQPIYANYGMPVISPQKISIIDPSSFTDMYLKQMDWLSNERITVERMKSDMQLENEKIKQLYQEMKTQSDSHKQDVEKYKQETLEAKQELQRLALGKYETSEQCFNFSSTERNRTNIKKQG